MAARVCTHSDVREFDGLRTCLACGETRFRDEVSPDQAAAEEREYLYTDLRCLERGRTIRLVVLTPGDYDDSVYCTLVLSGIQHSEYDAVSYTWATEDGDDSKSHVVYIDGSVIHVTQNCHSALRQLRHQELHRRLWIDAICISQHNVHERNHQVSIMDRIYREARQVHVCVDDPTHEYSIAMSWLSGVKSYSPMTGASRDEELQMLLTRRYFSRVWIIQEIVLARHIVLHVNNDQANMTHESLTKLNDTIRLQGPLRVLWEAHAHQDLQELLKLSIKCHCSDPRDHVYAILSLLPPGIRDLIPVDYSMDIGQVWANVATAFIAATHSLDIIAYAAFVNKDLDASVTRDLTIKDFHCFLLTGLDFKKPPPPPGWTSKVHLGTDSNTEISSQVVRLSPMELEQRMLPRLRVSAHCLGVAQSSSMSMNDACRLYADIDIYESPIPHVGSSIFREYRSDINGRGDVRRMLQRLRHRDYLEYGCEIFWTETGLGRSAMPVHQGDSVFHADGMSVQLLLRPVGVSAYRCVGVCWLESSAGLARASNFLRSSKLIEVY